MVLCPCIPAYRDRRAAEQAEKEVLLTSIGRLERRLVKLSEALHEAQEESKAAEQTELKNMKLEHENQTKKTANSLKQHRIAETKHFETQAKLHNQSRILAKAERRCGRPPD